MPGGPASAEVIRITYQEPVAVEPPFVPDGPRVVVHADGTALVPSMAEAFVQPMVWPYETRSIDAAIVADLLTRAGDSGLLSDPEPRRPFPDVVDAPFTTIVITSGGQRHVHQVPDSPTPDEPEYLTSARDFRTAVLDALGPAWITPGAPDFYDATVLAVAAAPGQPRSGQPAAIAWTGAPPLADLAECTIVSDPATVRELVGQYAGQHYTDAGETYLVVARVAFPGDITC